MNLQITEKENQVLKVHNTPMNLDGVLASDFSDDWVLPTKSGFYLLITGSPGSGKTTLLNSIMTTKKKKGERQSYRKLFHKILIVSPTLGRGSSNSNDKFKDLPENQKFKDVNMEVLEKIQSIAQDRRDEGEHTIVIFDDVGASLRKSAQVERN